MNGGDVYRRLTGYVVPDHEGTAYSRTVTMLLPAGRLAVR